ncbi:MAG: hypothetical protein ACI8RD_006800 [Bacillariaceae sp.]|jgi:hypothetical protein
MLQTVLPYCQWNQHIWLIEARIVSKILEINETFLLYIVFERQQTINCTHGCE